MIWNDDKQKFEDLTAEEQRLADLMYKKGFGQAAKKYEQQPEVANNTTQAFDMSEMQKMMAEAVAAAVAPIKQELEETKQSSIESKRTSFLTQQETKLPAIYESLITGSTETEWQTSYHNALEQYKQDFKVTTNFGAPTPSAPKAKKTAKDFKKMSIQEKMELYKNDPELYKQLQNRA